MRQAALSRLRDITVSIILLSIPTACAQKKLTQAEQRLDKAATVLYRDIDVHVANIVARRLKEQRFAELAAELQNSAHQEPGKIHSQYIQELGAIAQTIPFKSKEALTILLAIHEKYPYAEVQGVTLDTLVNLVKAAPTEAGFKIVCQACRNSVYKVRIFAVRLVGEFVMANPTYAPRAMACLRERLDSSKERAECVQAVAIQTLVIPMKVIPGMHGLDELLKAAKDSRYFVRTAAYEALVTVASTGSARAEKIFESIATYCSHQNWVVREGTIRTIALLSEKALVDREKTIELLQRSCNDEDVCVRSKAIYLLNKLEKSETRWQPLSATSYTIPLCTSVAALVLGNRFWYNKR